MLALLVGALPLTLLPAYPLLVGAVLLRARLVGAAAAVVVAAHVAVVLPCLGADPLPPGAQAAPRLRVVVSNLYVGNPDPAATGRRLRALHPDVLVVPELTRAGEQGLRDAGLLDDLPHQEAAFGVRAETVGLFSRLPLTDLAVRTGGTRALPRATVLVGGLPVRLLPGHPLPPVLGWEPLWRRSLADLAAEVRAEDLPVLVAGDLNSDRDQAPFRRLLAAGLRDASDARGRGLARTWPAGLPVLQLDHVLVRDGRVPGSARLVPLTVRTVRVPGSDHRAVVADVAVLPAR